MYRIICAVHQKRTTMKYIQPKNIQETLIYIKQTIGRVNSRELTVEQGAANIVGATAGNTSYVVDAFFVEYPTLVDFIDLCEDAEIYGADEQEWRKIEHTFKLVQEQLTQE